MDRALKERTIGAVVLVAVAVLIVPVFLDGRSGDEATVTETVTLPGQNAQPRRQQTIVLERDREDPVPAPASATTDLADTGADPAAGSEPDDDAAKPSPVDLPPPVPAPLPAAGNAPELDAEPAAEEQAPEPEDRATDGGLWAVQLGSFSSRENAERLAADLRGAGYAAFLSRVSTSAGEMHRVRVGPQKDRDAARSVADALAQAGHQGRVVSHP
ncbi:MAG: SPOR domain-containing protein [Woeseiaceae bacterium]|nr:SPOR domain-containing protein [Woeseiaceae bacterium]